MKPRLIDAGALLHVLQSYDASTKLWPGIDRAIFHVKDAPTFDAAPVVHARWANIDSNDPWETYKCSNCGEIDFVGADPYCPRCGARMDAKEATP